MVMLPVTFTLTVLTVFTLLLLGVYADTPWSTTPFNPPSIPLAVRSPYLSAWLNQGPSGTALNDDWPKFWTGTIVGWAGYVKVDNATYLFLGAPNLPDTQKAIQKSMEFTSTQSTFVLAAGPVELTVAFLSPIEPDDFVKQSFPFSYLALTASSSDGKPHSVQVYTDMTAEWTTGNTSQLANWTTSVSDVITHQVQLQQQTPYTEVDSRIQQGSAYYSTAKTAGLTWQSGADVTVRGQFIGNGKLQNTQDTKFRAVGDSWPVFGFAHDLGNVEVQASPIVVAIGHARDPVIQYSVVNLALQTQSSYFWSAFPSIGDAIASFLSDYPAALSRAQHLDSKVQNDASAISNDYAAIAALSARQVLMSTEITLSKQTDGGYNTSEPRMWLRAGDVDTVDNIYPAWPFFLYVNATYGKALLLPLLEYGMSGQYPNHWAAHDLGGPYPQAKGHNDGKDTQMPIEETANMLIMVLSHAQRTNDNSLITTFFDLLDQWAQYLVSNTLAPADQFSTDIFAGSLANQTNLAVKGIIAIKAMSEIAALAGQSDRAASYESMANTYISQWQKLAVSVDKSHLTLNYGNDSSWVLAYNLYADKLLGTNMIPKDVYDMQTKWYGSVSNSFGVALDTRNTYVLSGWQIWSAATVTDPVIRDLFITNLKKYVSDGQSSAPLNDWYDTVQGKPNGFPARAVVGGHFALLTLSNSTSNSTSADGSPLSGSGTSTPKGSDSTSSNAVVTTPTMTVLLGVFLVIQSVRYALVA